MFKFGKPKLTIELTLDDNKLVSSISSYNTKIIDYLRSQFPDQRSLDSSELVEFFLYSKGIAWMKETRQDSWFQETHSIEDIDTIKSSRDWNDKFIEGIRKIDIAGETEEELVDNYMNYVYGTRLMAFEEMVEESKPTSISHPKLSGEGNRVKE